MSKISFRPAALDGVGLFVCLAGGSRTGKTFTALTLARGIAGPNGRIATCDTEGKRMSHYKSQFLNADGTPFDTFQMVSPFNGKRFVEVAKAAQEGGYNVLVIDSFSLEWTGAGGVLQTFEDEFEKAGFKDSRKNICWAVAKKEHKRMLDEMMQLTIPIIFCLRANQVPEHLGGGWRVQQDAAFLYEWTVALTLHPDTPGMPRYDMKDAKGKPLWKVQKQHAHLFPEGKLITAEAGAALQAWRMTDAAVSTTSVVRQEAPPTPDEIAERLVGLFENTETPAEHAKLDQDELIGKQLAYLTRKHPDLAAGVEAARKESAYRHTPRAAFSAATDALNDEVPA